MADNTLKMHFHSVMLLVKDLARSQEWYEQKLGMTFVRTDGHFKAVSLISPNYNRLTIWESGEGEPAPTIAAQSPYGVFVSDNLQGDRRTLLARGVHVSESDASAQGLRYFWITDPDGHRHCVVEFLPE